MNDRLIDIIEQIPNELDGQYSLHSNDELTAKIFQSDDHGDTFTNSTFGANMNCTCISGDGKYQFIGASGILSGTSRAVVSSNYGVSFSAWTGTLTLSVSSCSMSVSGKYQLIGTFNGTLHVSDDYGATWTTFEQDSDSTTHWYGASMSQSGQYMIVANNTAKEIWTSSDYGVTWSVDDTITSDIRDCAVSGDGTYMYYGEISGDRDLHISDDSGDTWSVLYATVGVYGLSVSYDGKYILFGNGSDRIWQSDDYGSSFVNDFLTVGPDIRTSSMSSTSQYRAIGDYNDETGFWISDDYGATWTKEETGVEISSVAINAIH